MSSQRAAVSEVAGDPQISTDFGKVDKSNSVSRYQANGNAASSLVRLTVSQALSSDVELRTFHDYW